MSGAPEIVGETSPNFRTIVVDGIFGHVDSIGLIATLYSETSILDKVLEIPELAPHRAKIRRTAEMEIIMSPMQLKSTYLWLEKKMKEYETLFGDIPSPEEVQTRARDLRK